MSLHVEKIAGTGAHKVAWLIHGILGSGRNWRSFVRHIVRAHPEYIFYLPDLRNHGATGTLPGPDSLQGCVDDLNQLPSPSLVIGHSFGGKVALRWAQTHPIESDVWILDSQPYSVTSSGQSEVAAVLRAIERVQTPAATRAEIREPLTKQGLSASLVGWLLTSTKETSSGWMWVYNLAGIQAMMADYFATDFGPFLDSHNQSPSIHLVRALNSDRWTPEALKRIQHRGSEVFFHELPNAGHWLHVDNPTALRAMMGF